MSLLTQVRDAPRQVWGRITESWFSIANFSTVPQEYKTILRRAITYTRRWAGLWQPPVDFGVRTDYDFWQKLYYGKVVGLELSGLLVKPLVSKVAAWALGRPPLWKCQNESSQDALDDWWVAHHPKILQAYRSSLKQGDSFLVINADLSVTNLNPKFVLPIVDDNDYATITGWAVTTVIVAPDEPLRRMVIVDEYYSTHRRHTVSFDGGPERITTYPNLIGRLPIIHIPNQVGDGEVFGHPEAEGTVRLLQRYGEVFDAAIEGNVLQGRPTPVINFEDSVDLDKFWTVYGSKETRELPDGTRETVPTLDVDLTQLLTMTKGNFEYKTPGNFTEDVTALLEIMFYLFIEHAEVPEFVMGNAIASSKASSETQMPVFEKFIEGKQGETRPWLVEIAAVVLAYLSLMQPGVVAEEPELQWRKISQDGRLTLATVEWAYSVGLLDAETAILLAPVEVDNIKEVLEKAKKEFEQRQKTQAELEVMTFAGRQNASAKAKTNPIGDDAEVEDTQMGEMVHSKIANLNGHQKEFA